MSALLLIINLILFVFVSGRFVNVAANGVDDEEEEA